MHTDTPSPAAPPALAPLGRGAQALLVAQLLRKTMQRADQERIGEYRYKNLSTELTGALHPAARATDSVFSWYREICVRFGVAPGGDEKSAGYPVAIKQGEVWQRWDLTLARLDIETLRSLFEESSALYATFATQRPVPGEEEVFAALDVEERPPTRPLPLPETILPTRAYRSVWTATAPIAHGADEKTGNITLMRRERSLDPRTGAQHDLPFLAGNAIRGAWRDLAFLRYLHLLGLSPREIRPMLAHAMLSGGVLEKGADTAAINLSARETARRLCPPWDLFGGALDQQVMGGLLRVSDAVLVCRETAWLVQGHLGLDEGLDAVAAQLPEADSLTVIRQSTRHAHRDIAGSDGAQMLVHQEVVKQGAQFLHTLRIAGVESAAPVTLSCLADLLGEFQASAEVGGSTARGFGTMALHPYTPGPGAPALPSPDLYLAWIQEHREEARSWCLEPSALAPAPKAPKGKAPKGKAKPDDLLSSEEEGGF